MQIAGLSGISVYAKMTAHKDGDLQNYDGCQKWQNDDRHGEVWAEYFLDTVLKQYSDPRSSQIAPTQPLFGILVAFDFQRRKRKEVCRCVDTSQLPSPILAYNYSLLV